MREMTSVEPRSAALGAAGRVAINDGSIARVEDGRWWHLGP